MLLLRPVMDMDLAAGPAADSASLTLPFADRRRSRLRTRLDDGRDAALWLAPGTCLRDGDRLIDVEHRLVVAVRAALETLSIARAGDALLLMRAAYHLGNRHVPVEIGPQRLAYQHDHVLDEMLRKLGLAVEVRQTTFEPEAGGYAARDGHGHAGHSH